MDIFSNPILSVLVAIILGLVTVYYYSVKTFNYWRKLGLQYVEPEAFFGNAKDVIFRKKSSAVKQQEIYNLYPNEKYIGMYAFRTPILMIRDPYLIHRIMTKDFSYFYDRGINVDEKLDLLSSHLVNLRGQKWKSLRNKLSPAFSSSKLKTMTFQLGQCADSLSNCLESLTAERSTLNMRDITARFATDVIGSCIFGLKFNAINEPDSEFRKMGTKFFKPSYRVLLKFIFQALHPSLPYYLNLKFLPVDVESFFFNLVKSVIQQRENAETEQKDFIQLLLELRKKDLTTSNNESKEESFVLDDQVLASNVFVFFTAGFESTSSTISFMLLELAANPDIQESVRSEILQALEQHNGELSYDTIKDLPYTEKVISETLRKYPIFAALIRECTQPYQLPNSNLTIEEGTKIVLPAFAIHRDPAYFPDPERFDPERFSSENKSNIIPGSYIPFGDGPRYCIGMRFAMMEMKYAFFSIIPKFRFTMSDQTVYPVVFKKGNAPMMAPDHGIWLNVERRI